MVRLVKSQDLALDKVLDEVLATAIALIPNAHAGSIFVLENDEFEMRAAVGYDLEKFRGVKFHFTDLVNRKSLYSREHDVVIFQDLDQHVKQKSGKKRQQIFQKYGRVDEIKSMMSTGIFLKTGELYAILNFDNFETTNAFTDFEKDSIKQFAKIIENYINVTKVANKLLRGYDQYELLFTNLTHELMNINTGLDLGFELLKSEVPEVGSSKAIKKIKKLLNRQNNIINRAKLILKSEELRNSLVRKDLLKGFHAWITKITQEYPNVVIDFHNEVKADAMPVMINELAIDVIQNLMENSIKYRSSNKVHITITIKRFIPSKLIHSSMIELPSYWIVHFCDKGIGITDSQKQNLFKPFYRVKETKPGMGLGLSLVSKIITSYGGFIYVKDRIIGKSSKGVCFVIGLPIAKH